MTKAPSIENEDHSFAVVTSTYFKDLARCELLAESLDRVAPRVPHYLIVDRRDRYLFRHLEHGRRRIIESEALVGKWLWQVPGHLGLWLSVKAPPVRGWIIQQILKVGAIEAISERTLVFCDSDMAFFRRFDRSDLLTDGKVGLLDVEVVNDDIRRWTVVARRLLGLSQYTGGYHGHVGNMICWNRETVKAMQQRIEDSTGINWQVALARTSSLSEYMLYGIFVREVQGYDGGDHAPSTVPLVKSAWGIDLRTDSAIDSFFADFDLETVGIMIHSKDRVNLARIRFNLERWWNKII